MALNTYADLQAALGTWNVDKTNLPTADLIALAEARMSRDLRLRMQEVDNALSTSVGSRYVALPPNVVEPLALFLELAGGRCELVNAPDTMETSSSPGQARLWTVDGSNLAFERPADQVYSLTLKALQGFDLTDGANAAAAWLYAAYPDVYLAAGNVEAALWLQDDAQAQRWQLRYADAVSAINQKEQRPRALAALRVDPALQPRGRRRGTFDITRG